MRTTISHLVKRATRCAKRQGMFETYSMDLSTAGEPGMAAEAAEKALACQRMLSVYEMGIVQFYVRAKVGALIGA